MKIDTCIIVKNEDATIENLINQFLEFSNEVHITDTGSTDNTISIIEKIKKNNSNVYLHHFDWCMDFSKARNYSLTCYECKADYQFWCDGDDELNDILISTLQEFAKSETMDADIYFMKYQYAPPSNYTHWRTSLLKVSSKLKWNDPIHEYIGYTYDHKTNYKMFDNGSLIIHHKSNLEEHKSRNLNIFLNMEKNNYKFSCRNRYYYARELSYNKLYDTAIYHFHKCIDSEENNRLDKYNACIKLFELNDKEAIDYFFKLFKIGKFRKDLFYYVAKYYFNNDNIDLAKLYYLLCINCTEPEPGLSFGYVSSCHINSLLQLGVIAFKQKNIKDSLMYNQKILDIDPNNEVALGNIVIIKKYEDNKIK